MRGTTTKIQWCESNPSDISDTNSVCLKKQSLVLFNFRHAKEGQHGEIRCTVDRSLASPASTPATSQTGFWCRGEKSRSSVESPQFCPRKTNHPPILIARHYWNSLRGVKWNRLGKDPPQTSSSWNWRLILCGNQPFSDNWCFGDCCECLFGGLTVVTVNCDQCLI